MTREEKLYSMTGLTLIQVADSLGVKVRANKTRNALKEAKAKVIERILAAEAAAATEEEQVEEQPTETEEPIEQPIAEPEEKQEELPLENVETVEQPKPKRGALLEYDGRSQNICAWADELGISANTLYGRIYKMGWSVEKAFSTPARSKK